MKRWEWEKVYGNPFPYDYYGRPNWVAGTDEVFATIDTVNTDVRRNDSPSKHGGYTINATKIDANAWNDQLNSHQVYKNIVGNQLDTTNAVNVDDVTHDVTKTLYEKRPNFPRVFKNLSRAQFVGDLLINRTLQGKPMTPSRRQRRS